MYGVGFAIEKLEFLLSPSDFKETLRDGNEERSCLPRLSREDLEAWLSSRLGSLTGQVMTLCKVSLPLCWKICSLPVYNQIFIFCLCSCFEYFLNRLHVEPLSYLHQCGLWKLFLNAIFNATG